MAKGKKPAPAPARRAPVVEDTSAAIAATAPRREPAAPKTRTRQDDADEKEARLWQNRVTASNKQYKNWSDKFECDRLDKYYEGKQWSGLSDEEARHKYVVNLVFATVESQLPSLLFSHPKVNVEARPQHEATGNSDAGNRATLIEQTLQTLLDNPTLHFTFETTLALRDAYSRFSVVEVGYTDDYLDNPNAGKPVLNDNDEAIKGEDGQALTQPLKVLKRQQAFVTRLVPEHFRVSPGRNQLETNDWAAYYDWFYLDDVKRNKNYTHTEDLKPTGRDAADVADTADGIDDLDESARRSGMVKVWRIWDFRTRQRLVLADGHKWILQKKPFTTFPIADLKFYEGRNSYYPVPPIYNWIAPQDGINESRQQQKVHQRRSSRRYMREPSVSKVEFEKLESDEDMVCIEVPKVNPSPIAPIPDAPLDGSAWTELSTVMNDFTLVTGVGGEARGVPEAPTATQANIVNVRAQLRESRARDQVADWLGRISRLLLLAIRDRQQLPMMVKQNVDPFAFQTDPATVQRTANGWREVKKEDIDELDVDVKIDVSSLSPVAEEAQRNAWNVVLGLLTNQALLLVLMTPNPAAPQEPSPLLRKTLFLNGIKSDQEVREIWRVGQVVVQQMAMMAMAAAAAKGGAPAGGMAGAFGGGGDAVTPGMPAGPTTGTPATVGAAAA